MTRLAGLLLLLALSGCGGPPLFEGLAESCRIAVAARLPVRHVRDFVLVPAQIAGQDVQMLVDTGAEVSTITPELARSLGLAGTARPGRLLVGVGGNVRSDTVVAHAMRLGGLDLANMPLSVSVAGNFRDLEPPVAGLLGGDVLSRYDVDLDIPGKTMTLYRVADCPGFHPWKNSVAVPLARSPGGLIFAVAEVEGRAVRALIDTGARASVMTQRLAYSLGVTTESLNAAPPSEGHGAGGLAVALRRHDFASVKLGRLEAADVPISVSEQPLPAAELLLGDDILGLRRLWISYPTATIFMP